MVKITQELEAFIFDLDGVITDTVEYHYLSWKRLMEEEGIPFNWELNEKLRGLSRSDSLEIILKGRVISEDKKLELLARKNRYYLELINHLSKDDLIPGIEDLLIIFKKNNYKIALASSSKNARLVIKKLGIKDFFEVIADGNSVKRIKPAPDIFLYTAEKLGIRPKNCMVIEDGRAGIKAAQAAEMTVIGIGPEKRVGEANYHYDTIVEFINTQDIIR